MFWQLLLAHLITDFILQNQFIYNWRLKSWFGSLFHSLLFGVVAGIICPPKNLILLFSILFITLFHFLIDSSKIKLQKKGFYYAPLLFWLDQALHISFIYLICLFLPTDSNILISTPSAIILSCGIIIFAFIKFFLVKHFKKIKINY